MTIVSLFPLESTKANSIHHSHFTPLESLWSDVYLIVPQNCPCHVPCDLMLQSNSTDHGLTVPLISLSLFTLILTSAFVFMFHSP